jgi:predicted nucleic acid-binding Zn ribbon protein
MTYANHCLWCQKVISKNAMFCTERCERLSDGLDVEDFIE